MLFENKYQIISLLGSGAFCDVCLGKNINTNEYVAIKLEKKNSEYNTLLHEAKIYIYLNKIQGIPHVKTFGESGDYNYLILERLGNSMYNSTKRLGRIPLCTLLSVAKDLLIIIKNIHEKGIIHRDIKPENFLFGYMSNKIYLIDFGLARQYIKNNVHIQNKKKKSLLGTSIFASIHNHNCEELTRRDDLESFVYSLLYCAKGYLPWQDIENKDSMNNEEYNNAVLNIKLQTSIEELCSDINQKKWKKVIELVKYVRNLDFDETPDYEKINSFLNYTT